MKLKIQTSIKRKFEADHSLPSVGLSERHHHAYELECGYTAEVDPAAGCAKPLHIFAAEVDLVVERLRGSYLNDLMPMPPTAEMLACWVLAQLPDHWAWVDVGAYGGYHCRVQRSDVEAFLARLRPSP